MSRNGDFGKRANTIEAKGALPKEIEESYAYSVLSKTQKTRSERLGTAKKIRLRLSKSVGFVRQLLREARFAG